MSTEAGHEISRPNELSSEYFDALLGAVQDFHFERAQKGLTFNGVRVVEHTDDHTALYNGHNVGNSIHAFINIVDAGLLLRVVNSSLIDSESRNVQDYSLLLLSSSKSTLILKKDIVIYEKKMKKPQHNVTEILTGICREGVSIDTDCAASWTEGFRNLLDTTNKQEVPTRLYRRVVGGLLKTCIKR